MVHIKDVHGKFYGYNDTRSIEELMSRTNSKNEHIRFSLNGKTQLLHRFVWEHFNGKIPNGYLVHHKDMNKANNHISNLTLTNKSIHGKVHKNGLWMLGKKQTEETKLKHVLLDENRERNEKGQYMTTGCF